MMRALPGFRSKKRSLFHLRQGVANQFSDLLICEGSVSPAIPRLWRACRDLSTGIPSTESHWFISAMAAVSRSRRSPWRPRRKDAKPRSSAARSQPRIVFVIGADQLHRQMVQARLRNVRGNCEPAQPSADCAGRMSCSVQSLIFTLPSIRP